MNERQRPSIGGIVGVAFWAICIAVFQAMLWFAWFIIMVKCAPPLEMVLAEREVLIPIMTQHLITMSRLTYTYWYLLVLFGFPLCLFEIIVLAVAATKPSRWLSVLRYVGVAIFSLAPLTLLLYSIVALALTIYVTVRDIVAT